MKVIQWTISLAVLICCVLGERHSSNDEALTDKRDKNLRRSLQASNQDDESTIKLGGRNLRYGYGYGGGKGGKGGSRSKGGSRMSKSGGKNYYGKGKGRSSKGSYGKGKGGTKNYYGHYKPRGKGKGGQYRRPYKNPPQKQHGHYNIFHRPLSYLFGSQPTPSPPTQSEPVSGGSPTSAPPPDTQSASTPAPTPSPTCQQKDLDVCVAIDRSGSICTPAGEPFISCLDNPDCGCENWDSVRRFTENFVEDTAALPETQLFSFVGYASTARVVAPLVGVEEAMEIAADFQYTGGWTNTGEAIQNCRTELEGGSGERTILLITDGTPTRPDSRPVGSGAPYTEATDLATAQANAAKGEGTTVITVFVNTATGSSSYLNSLATPGFYIEVENFSDLDNVSDSLLDLVQCS